MPNPNQWWPRSWGANVEYPELSQFSRLYFDQAPQAAYGYVTRPADVYGSRAYSNFLQANAGEYSNRYLADLATGSALPETSFYSWLTQSGRFNPTQDYGRLSPFERGERPSAFTGRARWVL